MSRILLAVCVLMIIVAVYASFKPTEQTVASDNADQQLKPSAEDKADDTSGHWQQLQPTGDYWPVRWDFQLRSHRRQLLLAGGQNTSGYLNDIWSSSNGSQWQQLPQPPWSARAYFQLLEFNNALFVIGGETKTGLSDDVWRSNDQGQSWQLLDRGEQHFGPRRLHQVVVFNDQLVLLGGEGPEQQLYNDIWTSSDGESWQQPTTDGQQWLQRKYFRAIAFHNEVWVLGGIDPSGANQVFKSSDLTKWRAETPDGDFWGERMFFSSTAINEDTLWFIGGGSTPLGSEANDILIASNSAPWTLKQDKGHFDRRGHHEAVVHDGKFYLIGGKREDAKEKIYHRDIWVLPLH